MKNKNSGFTLIELMIVIAIIAILMSYAIPAYRDYTVRAKAGEALSLSTNLKALISEAWVSSEILADYDSGAEGLPAATEVSGENVSQMLVTDGVIVATFFNDPTLDGNTLTLTPLEPGAGGNTGTSLMWQCTSSLVNRYLPNMCRTP